MPLSELEMFIEVENLAQSLEPLAVPTFRTTIVLFLIRIRKVLTLLRYGDENSKFIKYLKAIKLTDDTIDKLGFLGAGYMTLNVDGNYKVTIKTIAHVYITTFRGCRKMSNGSIIVSCGLAVFSTILACSPWFDHPNSFILLSQVFVKFAYASIKQRSELLKTIDETVRIKDVADYMME